MKKYYCIKCKNNKIHKHTFIYGSGLCVSCSHKIKYNKEAHNYKNGRYCKQYYCIDCGKKISLLAKRCSHCCKQGIVNPNSKGEITKKQYFCKCGKEITYKIALYGSGLCRSCCQIGKLHHRYKNGTGKLPYHFKFTKSLKKEIHERDNFICQCCGMTQKQHFDKYNRDIEVHHIDYDKFSCEKNDLITLCHQCNINANKDVDYWYAFYTYLIEQKSKGERQCMLAK